jgi:hypothetical protein
MQNSVILKHNLDIQADTWNLERIIAAKLAFNIPIYQRLYVWEAPQIKTLLEDLDKAQEQPGQDYFLGGIMLSPYTDPNPGPFSRYDLIDGQQRMLTLWLLARVLQDQLAPFLDIRTPEGSQSRITFAIRDYVNEYFSPGQPVSAALPDPELEPILKALDIIHNWFEQPDKKHLRSVLAAFIATRLQLNITIMPAYVKGTVLFEAMNNRGEQLQHHQILKSLLLNELPEAQRHGYHQLWEACADMNNYVERNIKQISGLPWEELVSPGSDEVGVREDVRALLTRQGAGDTSRVHLLTVLGGAEQAGQTKPSSTTVPDDYDAGPVESIISFPMLLLHVLRVWLQRAVPRPDPATVPPVHEKQLLQLFDQHFFKRPEAEKSLAFLQLLWKIRVNFDRYVIKWLVKDQNKPYHAISRLYRNKEGQLTRRETSQSQGFTLLQSMLYHSQESITQYWLTPFLQQLLQPAGETAHYAYLRRLDNYLFCSGQTDYLSHRSWQVAGQEPPVTTFQMGTLNRPQGTGFSRYWFYKLDFVLWYDSDDILPLANLDSQSLEKWRNFRMTSRTSVEHISAQHHEEGDHDLVYDPGTDDEAVKKDKQNDFGNLVLVTPSINSSYGNKSFAEKKARFATKSGMESLKSALIFQNPHWSFGACEAHREDMIDRLKTYFLRQGMLAGLDAETEHPAPDGDA